MAEKSKRDLQIEEQKKRAAAIRQNTTPSVRVSPASEEMRKVLKHPSGGIAFPAEGSVEWPDDSFTRRRIAEGSVIAETPEKPSPPTP